MRESEFGILSPGQSPSESLSRKDIFSLLKTYPEFIELYRELCNLMCVPQTNEQILVIKGRFAGALFELAARHQVKAVLPSDCKLLTPNETAILYHELYGGPIIENQLNSYGTDRNIPDGIVLPKRGYKQKVAQRVYEFTLVRNEKRFTTKIESMIHDRRKFPNIFGESEYVFYTPQMDNPPKVLERYDWISHEYLPFTHSQFGDCVNGILYHYDSGPYQDSASPMDFQYRIKEQTGNAFQALISNHTLTWIQESQIMSAIQQGFPIETFLN